MTRYDFATEAIPDEFFWFNEPTDYSFDGGLSLLTKPKTDFWQRTHYGFRRDDGHCLFTKCSGDFSITTCVSFEPEAQYDQSGLMVRVDAENWIKCSTELENAEISRLGTVVTNGGYSDWATQDISSAIRCVHYRISRTGKDFLIEHSVNGSAWYQMRIAHLGNVEDSVDVGIYACSPIGEGFRCRFEYIEIADSHWV